MRESSNFAILFVFYISALIIVQSLPLFVLMPLTSGSPLTSDNVTESPFLLMPLTSESPLTSDDVTESPPESSDDVTESQPKGSDATESPLRGLNDVTESPSKGSEDLTESPYRESEDLTESPSKGSEDLTESPPKGSNDLTESPYRGSDDRTNLSLSHNVIVSPGKIRKKKYEIHTDKKPWLDALSECKNRGYRSLVYTQPEKASLKTVRKSLQQRGYSQIEVWTGYIYYNYDWMNSSVLIKENNCIETDAEAFDIALSSEGRQCVTAVLDDMIPDIVMATKPCTESYPYVCYLVDSDLMTMDVKTDIQFDWYSKPFWNVQSDVGQDDEQCQNMCLEMRYCLVTSYVGENTCKHIKNIEETKIVLSYTHGNETIAFKNGDIVTIMNNSSDSVITTSTTFFGEFPCEPKQEFSSYIQSSTTKDFTFMSELSNGLSSSLTGRTGYPDVVFATPQIPFTKLEQNIKPTESKISHSSSVSEQSKSYFSEMSVKSTESSRFTMTDAIASDAQNTLGLSFFSQTSESLLYSGSNYESLSSSQTTFKLCQCPCQNSGSWNTTSSSYYLDISKIAVNKTNLSSYKRKFVSVTDTRTSSKTIGCFGAVILTFCVIFLIILDSSSLLIGSPILKMKKQYSLKNKLKVKTDR